MRDLRRPCPPDFAALAPGMFHKNLMAHYGAGTDTVRRWAVECAVRIGANADRSKLRQLPDGFALVAPTMTIKELRLRFHACHAVIYRWLEDAGVKARKTTHWNQPGSNVRRVTKDGSRTGIAAEYLRRFGPVYRCNKIGGPDTKGKLWRRGTAILTDDELIDRAQRNGWNPDAWREIAA